MWGKRGQKGVEWGAPSIYFHFPTLNLLFFILVISIIFTFLNYFSLIFVFTPI